MLNTVIKLVAEYYESRHQMVTDKWVTDRVFKWYANTDIADPELLAAAAIHSDYEPGWSEQEVKNLTETLYHKYY